MAIASFNNIAYQEFGFESQTVIPNPVLPQIDFGSDNILSLGDETTITFQVGSGPSGSAYNVNLVGFYVGTDDNGAAYVNVPNDGVVITPIGTPDPGYQIFLEQALVGNVKVTNEPIVFGTDYFGPGYNENEDLPICFAEGTLIATPSGERSVESLKIGDDILTATNTRTTVKWIGRQTVNKIFWSEDRCCPVMIRAGALAEGMPHTDLVVTADHGMLIDGIIAHAGSLVNGTSIIRVPYTELAERVTYYHIETEGHEVVLANGTPAETFVDNVTRRRFDNYAEYQALYGDGSAEIVEMPLPRAMSRRQLPQAIRQRLADRAVVVFGTEFAESA